MDCISIILVAIGCLIIGYYIGKFGGVISFCVYLIKRKGGKIE